MAHVRVQRAVHEGRDRLFAYLDGPDAVWGMDVATGHQWWYDDTHRDLVLAGVVSHLALNQNGEAPSSVPAAPAPQLPLAPVVAPDPAGPYPVGPYPAVGQSFRADGHAVAAAATEPVPATGRRQRREPAAGRRARPEPTDVGSLLPGRRSGSIRRAVQVAAVAVVLLGASVGGWSMLRSGDGAASETPGGVATLPDNVTVGSTCLQLGLHTTTAAGAPVVCATFGAKAVWTPVDATAKAGKACAKAGNVVMDVGGTTRLVCTATKSGTPRWIVSAT